MQDALEEFEIYRAKYLNMIDHNHLKDLETKRMCEFIIATFYEEFKIAQKMHKSFFWHLLDPNDPDDYQHLQNQARAWGLPVFSFEKENRDRFYKRMVAEGLNFIQWMGTEAQTEEILTTIFGNRNQNWWYSDYHKKDQEFVSIEVYRLKDEQKLQAMEYLERAIPPYLKIEIINFLLNPTQMKNWAKKYSHDELVKEGGDKFITKELNEFIADAILLPQDAFRLDKIEEKISKLNLSTKRELLKIREENGTEKKIIILFTKPNVKLHEVNIIIDNFFLRNDSDIYVFSNHKGIYKYEENKN
ncbi:hypothetical protein [Borrelia sp. P9F1]|uniref:hypothetical protein n=1 Tax=Borrelia sp. P9F1 TaxID=3058374 RepID=UPI002647C4D9|nr:hypothetical protein [Borrelia sp. P9F1]WKC58566.1 hypothetical protein QYZ68_05035 [Borrelia sp. P9F1]